MSASQVHAVIAAGLKNPGLLARWKQEPDILRACGVDPDDVDIEALWKFAGLTTKVRHNGLRADIPLTFRLLNIAGLEIEVFGAYATFHADKSFGSTVQARSDELLLFLEQWLDCDKREHALLWDLIRHELALARLSKLDRTSAEPQLTPSRRGKNESVLHRSDAEYAKVAQSSVSKKASNSQPRLRPSSVPRVRGEIILHEMRSDPRVVETLLRQKIPNLEQVPLDRFYFCYWCLNSDEYYVLELDVLGFYILSTINGERPVAELSYLLTGVRRAPRSFVSSLAKLASVGIMTFD